MSMPSLSPRPRLPDPDPDGWTSQLRTGQAVELVVYGDRMTGRLVRFTEGRIDIIVPRTDQPATLQVAMVPGVVSIPIDGGAASAPVSCLPNGEAIRLQVVGPVQLVQRRVHQRRAIDVAVTLTWPGDRPGSWEQAITRTEDISVGGLRVQTAKVVWPSPGTQVLLVLDLPDGPAALEARAVGKSPDYGLRLIFDEVAHDVSARIAAYVTQGPHA